MSKVLIVDDNKNMRVFLIDVVELHRHTTLEASDGEVAWDILKKNPVDLVITDIVMPHMNGLELLKKIRSSNPALPVIVVTAGGYRAELLSMHAGSIELKRRQAFTTSEVIGYLQAILDRTEADYPAGSVPES